MSLSKKLGPSLLVLGSTAIARAQQELTTYRGQNASGILFCGSAPHSTPDLGGTLCVRQPVHRTAVQSSGGTVGPQDCSGTFSFDFNAHVASGLDPTLGAGDEVFAQYWSRDSSFVSTTNLTDAVAFYVYP